MIEGGAKKFEDIRQIQKVFQFSKHRANRNNNRRQHHFHRKKKLADERNNGIIQRQRRRRRIRSRPQRGNVYDLSEGVERKPEQNSRVSDRQRQKQGKRQRVELYFERQAESISDAVAILRVFGILPQPQWQCLLLCESAAEWQSRGTISA